MNKRITILALFISLLSCKKEVDYQIDYKTLEVNDFIWKAMNSYYLWKDEVPVLSDSRFKSQSELNNLLDDYNNSEAFFESLIYKRNQVDHWSWVVDDYEALFRYFQGIRTTTGMRIGLVREHSGSNDIFAYVKYVLPGSDAENKGVVRGNIFRKINNQKLTIQNYRNLFNNENLSIELATWSGGTLTDTGIIINLHKTQLNENPVYKTEVLHFAGKNIGYLMYNGFTGAYNQALNDAIGDLKAQDIDELILDLRYNPGGSVATMQYLASMITGQFTGQTLLEYQWNPQRQIYMQNHYQKNLKRYFVNNMADGTPLNHLNLNKVYIIATGGSASASESLMNCLEPYVDVIHIGTPTHGKYTASVTLFDSPDFSGRNVNPNHKWALQPIVLKVSNADGVTDFVSGLQPDVDFHEDYAHLGVLGNVNEPLLNRALQYIQNGSIYVARQSNHFEEIYYKPEAFYDEMYVDLKFE